jgi:hypothetical protein
MSNKIINLIIDCPHCKCPVEIIQLNCCIFRHGIIRKTGNQIPPHSSKEVCEQYIQNEEIYGCGKPFRIITNENNEYVAIICDYI